MNLAAGAELSLCQYIPSLSAIAALRRNEIIRRRLAGLTTGQDLVGQLLAFVELVHARAFDRADMNEHILASVIRLDEAEAFGAVEPLHGADRHRFSSS
jgi:hypothetical protein